jgi:hypothetical protein
MPSELVGISYQPFPLQDAGDHKNHGLTTDRTLTKLFSRVITRNKSLMQDFMFVPLGISSFT